MDAGRRHKTPKSKMKDFIIPGTASSTTITFASVLHAPISTGWHEEGQVTSANGMGCIMGEELSTYGTHISYYEKWACLPFVPDGNTISTFQDYKKICFLLWRETLSYKDVY